MINRLSFSNVEQTVTTLNEKALKVSLVLAMLAAKSKKAHASVETLIMRAYARQCWEKKVPEILSLFQC